MSQTPVSTETPREFECRIMKARGAGQQFIEASEEIIKNYVPTWKPEDLMFIYRDIPVFAHGAKEKWDIKHSIPTDMRGSKWK